MYFLVLCYTHHLLFAPSIYVCISPSAVPVATNWQLATGQLLCCSLTCCSSRVVSHADFFFLLMKDSADSTTLDAAGAAAADAAAAGAEAEAEAGGSSQSVIDSSQAALQSLSGVEAPPPLSGALSSVEAILRDRDLMWSSRESELVAAASAMRSQLEREVQRLTRQVRALESSLGGGGGGGGSQAEGDAATGVGGVDSSVDREMTVRFFNRQPLELRGALGDGAYAEVFSAKLGSWSCAAKVVRLAQLTEQQREEVQQEVAILQVRHATHGWMVYV